MLTAAIILVVLIVIIAVFAQGKELPVVETEEQRAFKANPKFATEYITGHPQIKKPEPVYLVKEANGIALVTRNLYLATSPHHFLGSIPYPAIVSIETDTAVKIEKDFSLGRFMVMGIYAFAWLKKTPKSQGFLLIKWTDNEAQRTTVFRNEGVTALQDVASAKAAILQWASNIG